MDEDSNDIPACEHPTHHLSLVALAKCVLLYLAIYWIGS